MQSAYYDSSMLRFFKYITLSFLISTDKQNIYYRYK